MAVFSGMPMLSKRVRDRSKLFFLFGTGALTGILCFDLLPDLFGIGGISSLWSVGVVWLLYSLLHFSHLGHHHQGGEPHSHQDHSVTFFLTSMVFHCLASGVLLVASAGFSGSLNRTVFIALLSHKAYESLTVSSVLVEKQKSRLSALISILAYSLSLPAGVILTLVFRASLSPKVALVAMSLAAGTLLGCLIFDFLLPTLGHLKTRRMDFGWILLGMGLTELALHAF